MILRIKEKREERGYSLSGFATLMGVSPSVVCNWESEVALPRTRQLPEIAALLGCDIGDLFVNAEEENV